MQNIVSRISQTVEVYKVVCEAIREVDQIPSGHLYMALMSHGFSLENYNKIIGQLEGMKLISITANVIRWIGPKIGE